MSKKPYPSEIADRFQVRMPDGLRDRIAESAKMNNRSMNAEIVARLEASFTTEADQFAALKLNASELIEGAIQKAFKASLAELAENMRRKSRKSGQLKEFLESEQDDSPDIPKS